MHRRREGVREEGGGGAWGERERRLFILLLLSMYRHCTDAYRVCSQMRRAQAFSGQVKTELNTDLNTCRVCSPMRRAQTCAQKWSCICT